MTYNRLQDGLTVANKNVGEPLDSLAQIFCRGRGQLSCSQQSVRAVWVVSRVRNSVLPSREVDDLDWGPGDGETI